MTARIAILSDVHGNLEALTAVRTALKKESPDAVLIAGDHVMNGPDPAGAVDALREMEATGATIVQGNTDVAVADFDYSAAFPWATDGVPDTIRDAAEWAHDALGDDRIAWLRRLPAERRLVLEDTMVLACHGSPGSQTQGFDAGSIRRSPRARRGNRCPGHLLWTHPPAGDPRFRLEDDRQRRLRRVRVRWRPYGVVGTRRAGRRRGPTAEIRRTEFDTMAVANAISARGLAGDVYRAATVRTGKLVR